MLDHSDGTSVGVTGAGRRNTRLDHLQEGETTMTHEPKPKIENLDREEEEALTLEEAEEAQGGVGLTLPPSQGRQPPPPAPKR
jgi:hypothetical protein